MIVLEKCLFTDLPTINLQESPYYFYYEIKISPNFKCGFMIDNNYQDWVNSEYLKNNKYIIEALLLNEIWIEKDKQHDVLTLDILKEFIDKNHFLRTPNQKQENLFLYLYSLQTEDGKQIDIRQNLWENNSWKKLYFRSIDECEFYIKSLEDNKLINTNLNHSNNVIGVSFSIQGLNKAISLFQEGENSNKCFIAMSFDSKMADTREIIKQVLRESGYEPIIIDEEHLNSDQTINDAIIANLKKCKFCIADFSKHSNGVYFESGFALGQGKKVIYLCSEDEFKNTHFDIKPLQHIIYKSLEELRQNLIYKIQAFID